MLILEAENLTKYYGKNIGVKNINLDVSKGEIYGLAGPNGSGKSTIVNLLLNFIFPSTGRAQILGMDIIKKSAKLKRYISYIPASAHYYSLLTPLELLYYTMSFYNKKDKDLIYKFSELFKINLKKQISELSQTDIKKISIIIAFLIEPRLIIMDEPLNGLDKSTVNILLELIETKNRDGLSILWTSENLKELQSFCGRIAKMEKGHITDILDNKKIILSSPQIKKVMLSCKDIPLGTLKNIAGDSLQIKDGNIFFNYSGDVGELLAILNQYNVKDLIISNSNLGDYNLHSSEV